MQFYRSEQVPSKNVVLQPREAFVLRSETSVHQKRSLTDYFRYSIYDL